MEIEPHDDCEFLETSSWVTFWEFLAMFDSDNGANELSKSVELSTLANSTSS